MGGIIYCVCTCTHTAAKNQYISLSPKASINHRRHRSQNCGKWDTKVANPAQNRYYGNIQWKKKKTVVFQQLSNLFCKHSLMGLQQQLSISKGNWLALAAEPSWQAQFAPVHVGSRNLWRWQPMVPSQRTLCLQMILGLVTAWQWRGEGSRSYMHPCSSVLLGTTRSLHLERQIKKRKNAQFTKVAI